MKKSILLLMFVLAVALTATAALADGDGPAYGDDPTIEPPRAGVGNANSGNHNMHVKNYRNRWSHGVETLTDLGTRNAPVELQAAPVRPVLPFSVVLFGRMVDVILIW